MDAFELGPQDFFPSGIALISQSVEHPQLIHESLFTAERKTIPTIKSSFPTGIDFPLERSRDLFAVIHVERISDGKMQITTIPLPYGGWRAKDGRVSFTLRSPEELELADPKFGLNIEGGLPVIRGDRLAKGLTSYAAFRRKALASAGDDQRALGAPELERFEVKVAEQPAAEPAKEKPPELEVAPTPAPLPTKAPAKTVTVVPAPTPRPLPAAGPAVPLPPRAVVRNAPTPAPTPAPTVPPPPITPAGATPPRAVPVAPTAGRIVNTSQASSMVEQFKANEPTVLTGEFVVTGVRGQRVGLRTRESLRDSKADPTQPGTSAALIVVDFPPGVTPPAKDSTITRSGERGFFVRDVIRGPNNQITIVAADRQN